MFNKKTAPAETPLDKAITDAYANLAGFEAETKEHAKTVKQIAELEKIRTNLKKKSWLFTPDTMLLVGANLLGIILVLNHERASVITSKAFGLVSKNKI